MGEVFEKPLLDHLNGELCPLPRVAPLAASTRMLLQALSWPLPTSQAQTQ